MHSRAILSLFRKILYELSPDKEPWFHKQYYAFECPYTDDNFDLVKAIRCLALMYWKGMNTSFVDIIGCSGTSNTINSDMDVDWINTYTDYVLSDSLDICNMPIYSDTPESPPVHRLLCNGSYFINSISEHGTSETGKIINYSDIGLNKISADNDFNELLRSSLSFADLIKFTSARLPGIPVLKDLGILQIQDLSAESDYPLYCWLPERCLLIPFKSKQMAEEVASDYNSISDMEGVEGVEGMEGVEDMEGVEGVRGMRGMPCMHVICMRDVIVKITPDMRIYSKMKKTYYILQKVPEYLQPLSATHTLTRSERQQCVRIMLAKQLLELDKKCYCLGVNTRGEVRLMYFKNAQDLVAHNIPLPPNLLEDDKSWLLQLGNHDLMKNPRIRVNYNRLVTEFT